MSNTLELQTDSILNVPLENYLRDFSFIVNGKKFQTNKFISDLLSPKICQLHKTDITVSEYHINTKSNGNFQKILDLLSFNQVEINEEEIPFISEIISKLCISNLNINISIPKINLENVLELIKNHEKSDTFYSKNLSQEIDFLSEHFFGLNENQQREIQNLRSETIEKIVSNSKLTLLNEDQLLHFIVDLCTTNENFSFLYEYVYFVNVSKEGIEEFVSNFNPQFMTNEVWKSISSRLKEETKENPKRYHQKVIQKVKNYKEIPYTNNNLNGIFSFFRSNSNIKEEVVVTYSSRYGGEIDKLLDIQNQNNYFYTHNEPNSWICFEFKKCRIIPSNYSIRSNSNESNGLHLRNWVIEGSVDGKVWTQIDEQINCNYLNGRYYAHTFPLKQSQIEFKYIRIRQTGLNWGNNQYLELCSVEFYGKLI